MKKRTRESGQGMIESALSIMVFLALLIGTVDFGQFLYLHQSLTERARAAARYGAVKPYSYPGDPIKNVAVYGTPTPSTGAPATVPGLTTDMVRVDLIAEGTDASRVRVTISGYKFFIFSPWIARKATALPIVATIAYERGT